MESCSPHRTHGGVTQHTCGPSGAARLERLRGNQSCQEVTDPSCNFASYTVYREEILTETNSRRLSFTGEEHPRRRIGYEAFAENRRTPRSLPCRTWIVAFPPLVQSQEFSCNILYRLKTLKALIYYTALKPLKLKINISLGLQVPPQKVFGPSWQPPQTPSAEVLGALGYI